MTAQQREMIDRLFGEAATLPPQQLANFLTENCPDSEVRAELESLLGFLTDHPPEGVKEAIAETAASVADSALIGQRAGPYRIGDRIGLGGMGAVYRGVRADEQFQQTVAVKLLRFAQSDPASVERFRRERQILAALEHPHIARLLDGGSWIPPGATECQPYLVMEYVQGLPLTVYCSQNNLGVRDRVLLFRRLCDAVSYAHQHLVVHRDIKPSNILVTPDGTPKLLDFGIAKLLDSDTGTDRTMTASQWRAMTPDYASPEQVRGERVSTATDVYSLGAVLYELVSGRRARQFSEYDSLKMAREICEREMEPPSIAGGRELRGDLDVIILKAMQAEPSRRYDSVEQFSQDLGRYLDGRPILARPDTWTYRTVKFVRRNALGVAAATALSLALVGGIAVSTWEAMRASRAERAALRELDRATGSERAAERERDGAVRAEQSSTAERKKALAEKQRADTEAATAKAVNDFLQHDLLAEASSSIQATRSVNPDPDLKVRTALDRAAARIARKFDGQPLVEASIRQTIATAYDDLGLPREAQRHQERAVELRRLELGPAHRDTLDSMGFLAELYRGEGKYRKAESLFQEVLRDERRLFGDDNRETVMAMLNLGITYETQAKYRQSEELLIKVVEWCQRVLGKEHSDTLIAMANLGQSYSRQGKYSQAEVLHGKVLEGRRKVLGEQHPDTLASMHDLALEYAHQGKLSEAEALYAKVLALSQRVLGEEHKSTLLVMGELAVCYRREGKEAEAETLLSKAVAILQKTHGEEDRATLESMHNLGALYRHQGKYAEAERISTKVLDIRHRLLGDDHPDTLWTRNLLALVYRDIGMFGRAEQIHRQVIDALQRVLGVEHAQTLLVMDNLASEYRLEGKHAEAEALSLKVIETESRVLGKQHPNTLSAMNNLALLYLLQRKNGQAEALLKEVLDARRHTLGPQHFDTMEVLVELGGLRLAGQEYSEAESLFRHALSRYEEMSSAKWQRYYCQYLLGASLAGQKKYAEAEPFLISGSDGLREEQLTIPAEYRPVVEDAAEAVVQLYENIR